MLPNNLKVYVLGHSADCFQTLPVTDLLAPLDLNTLKLPIPNTNHIAETRFFLQDESAFAQDPEYIGLLTWRYDSKYPKLLRLSQLFDGLGPLEPKVVYAAQRTIDENEGRWTTQPLRYIKGGKGITYYLKEMANVMNVPLEDRPSLWANNFICHKSVLFELMAFFKIAFNHFHKKYGYDFDFEVLGNLYPIRKVAFFYELVTLLFFSNRSDLQIKPFPKRAPLAEPTASFRRTRQMFEPKTKPVKKVFHLVGFPHTQINKKFVHCAYTQKMLNFAKMMDSLGHDVYIYGRENCEAPCKEHVVCFDAEDVERTFKPNTLWIGQTEAFKLLNERVIEAIKPRQSQKDFICTLAGNLSASISDALPHLTTVEYGIGYSGVYSKFRVFESYAWMHTYYGSKSNGDASTVDGANYDCVIPNYYDPDDFKFSAEKGDYYLYIGRLAERKGVNIASTVCQIAGVRLLVAGAEGNPPDYGEYVGLVDVQRRSELMRKAKAVIVPTIYIEPFGGVHVEAMLCGTPVITSDYGVFTETVVPGMNGFRCRTVGEYLQAIRNVEKLDPYRIRKYALKNFSLERVRWQYDAYFDQLLTLWNDGFYTRQETNVNRYGKYIEYGMPEENAFEVKGLPKVSCYCLTYGRPSCLEEAIESFHKQDYEGPKELIILNDRADQELVYDHPDVKVINLKERINTLGAKHNECIRHCSGDILMCWDDDDIFLPHRISYSVQRMNKGVFHTRNGYSEDAEKKYSIFPPSAVAHSTHALARDLFERIGGYPDTDHVAVDQMFMQRITQAVGDYSQEVPIDDIFYVYRWNTVTTYHTSGVPSDTTNVSDITKAKVDAKVKSGELKTGKILLKPHWKYDYLAVAKQKTANKLPHIYQNPEFGENWFSYPNLYKEFVRNTPEGGVIVEVGVWKGKSIAFLAVEAANSGKQLNIYAVDTWRGSPLEDDHQNDWYVMNDKLYELFLENTKPLSHIIKPIRKPSLEAVAEFSDKSIDRVFIDAAHDFDSVVADIKAWLPKIKSGGVLAGHDWGWESVRTAVQATLPQAVPTNEDCWTYTIP